MEEIINRIRKFREDREWDQFHTPANLAKAISIESGELLEHFLWDDNYNKEEENETMKEFQYTITDPEGIHARPAGLFVKEAAAFPCKVIIEKDGKEADAKRIFAVMGLAVKCGQEITLKTDGENEEEAMEKLSAFLKENL